MKRAGWAIALAVLLSGLASVSGPAGATPHRWASVANATITPGVQVFIAGAQCTSNFVFINDTHVYLGMAAHCAGTGSQTDTNGCEAAVLPRGTRVDIQGASRQGTMVYNSWVTMQNRGTKSSALCHYNDFALVRVAKADRGNVNPSMPVFGGPTGLGRASALGDPVYGYGRSVLWMGLGPLEPKRGISLGMNADNRAHKVYTFTPGIPGDSGSGYLDGDGKAIGVLSTLEFLPMVGSNNVVNLRRALTFMRKHTSLDVKLAKGTEPFQSGLPL